jgi:hypothetical protein
LGTPISQGISIFPREISSFSHGKIEIPWKIEVPKLALNRQAARLVKQDEKKLKKTKTAPEPKATIYKKRKLDTVPSSEPKISETGEEATSTPSAAEVAEIRKVMTESPSFKLLSTLGSELTKFLQRKEQPSATEDKVKEQKKQRIVNVMQALEQTPPSALAVKTVIPANAEAEAEDAAKAKDAGEAEATMSDIDRLVSDMVAYVTAETNVAAEEIMAIVLDEGKEIDNTPSDERDFDLRHLGGHQLGLKEFAISCGYQPGSLLFGGVDEEILECIRDRAGAMIIGTLSNSVGFPKLEADISSYRRQHIIGSLFYSNFKVRLEMAMGTRNPKPDGFLPH